MPTMAGTTRSQIVVLSVSLFVYALGRICQLYPDKVPALLIVILQVVPPAVFALVHGSILYRGKGMAVFTGFCLGVASISETLGLRTGFPFGHYHFTSLMGPKFLQMPILLVLAYLGIGYCSWLLALLILRNQGKPLMGAGVITLPLLAALIMMAWDLSMDPIWSTLDRAWIWHDGGMFYGVPLSNLFGWYLTAYLFYQAFALYCRANPVQPVPTSRSYWRCAVVCYGICAFGNLLIFRKGLFPPAAADGSGRLWLTQDILTACVLVSLFVMGPMVLLAWHRVVPQGERSDGRGSTP